MVDQVDQKQLPPDNPSTTNPADDGINVSIIDIKALDTAEINIIIYRSWCRIFYFKCCISNGANWATAFQDDQNINLNIYLRGQRTRSTRSSGYRAQGPQGDLGPQGPQGIGAQGPQGPRDHKVWELNPQGPQGIGAQGPQGDLGPQGTFYKRADANSSL